ncbi:hypothetical protein [Chitinimonas lacunae]|uniref:Tetratricopeptide repeat protein n=1 Tax=Chitinimonas lacunae TaxID=1963018 RepID=A0ABV8MLT1_9NEIS
MTYFPFPSRCAGVDQSARTPGGRSAPKSILLALSVLALAACSTPKPVEAEPIHQAEARRLAKAAARASHEQQWQSAAALWQKTAQHYGALDNWQEAGYARLGEAQAWAKWDRQQSYLLLQELVDAAFYPALVRAEALYQQALLALGNTDWDRGLARLDDADRLCTTPCALAGAIANARARAAAGQGQWQAAHDHAAAALRLPDLDPAERANGLRRQGEALIRLGQPAAARPLLEAALEIDRRLARPAAIVADLALRAEAAEVHEAPLWVGRAKQACQDAGPEDCPAKKAK